MLQKQHVAMNLHNALARFDLVMHDGRVRVNLLHDRPVGKVRIHGSALLAKAGNELHKLSRVDAELATPAHGINGALVLELLRFLARQRHSALIPSSNPPVLAIMGSGRVAQPAQRRASGGRQWEIKTGAYSVSTVCRNTLAYSGGSSYGLPLGSRPAAVARTLRIDMGL